MNLYFHTFIGITCIIVIHVFVLYDYLWKINKFPAPLLLVTGILSARENFDLREAVRSSWLKLYSSNKNHSIKTWFILGKNDCKIPPEYRLSKYGCKKWNINADGLSDHFYTSQEIENRSCYSGKAFKQGFSFKVNHPVVIKRLGILYHLLMPNTETNIAILDVQSKEVLVQVGINKNRSDLENGFLYEDVDTILLPKYYEGMVLVEGYLKNQACSTIQWNDGGGIITFNRIYPTPSHLDSTEFRNCAYSAASIQFFVHDLKGLKHLISSENRITSKWLSHLEIVNKKLLIESEEKQDILFVDVVDTYRNLPAKLLHFYKWAYQNYEFSYLMKIDDDTVINIAHLIGHMKSQSAFKPDEHWIWSRFRKDWPVNYVGKWSDYDYRSPIYPAFPCGATYIMSYKTVQWLSLNADSLFPYQGEDVSLGIWLSAIKSNFIDDEHFECDSTCSKRSYNRAQLTSDQIYEVWSLYETCQNLCSCY